MPQRTRQRLYGHESGTLTRQFDGGQPTVFYSDAVGNIDKITDITPGKFNALSIAKYTRQGGAINGRTKDGANFIWSNFFPLNIRNPELSIGNPELDVIGSPTDGEAATLLLARTNPSRADVDLPLFVYELRELPDLIRRFHGPAIRRAADANLRYQFGIRPLVSDLIKLCDFSQQVRNRTVELEALYKSGLRRKRTLFEGSVNGSASVSLNTLTRTVNSRRTTITKERVWGYVEWYPNTTPPKTDAAMLSLARRAVLGLDINFSTAWNAIPWSWLVDWCANVGQFLEAHRNIVGASPKNLMIMRRKESETTHAYTGSHIVGTTWTNPKLTVVRKSRKPASPSLSANLPFLSGRQLSILGSIAAVRNSRTRR